MLKEGLRTAPSITIVVPCFNEEDVLAETAKRIRLLLNSLLERGLASDKSGAVFVDDGSHDRTWPIIEALSQQDRQFGGIKLSHNCGHQNALLCGLLQARGDALISIDADLQDDVEAIYEMVEAYRSGADIVYGVRANRDVDSRFKRLSAEAYYRFLRTLGVEVVYNHADFRLMSRRAIEALRQFKEVNLFLRGIVPHLGFTSQIVSYRRQARFAGTSKYSITQMSGLALEGITSFSARPLRWITGLGFFVSAVSFLIGVWAIFVRLFGDGVVPGWASIVVPTFFLGGVQLLSLGVIGEYVGRIYLETKQRPRFIVERSVGVVQESPLSLDHEN